MKRGEQEQKCLDFAKKFASDAECIYGLTRCDCQKISEILRATQPNPSLSKFPDFIFPGGFIEHFQISSSKTTKRKGARHKQEEATFNDRVERESIEFEKYCNEYQSDNVRSKMWVHKNPEHRYEWLCQSLMDTWTSHIEGFQNYTGDKETGIFMVEYSEHAMAMYEQIYTNDMNGITFGDLKYPQTPPYYSLARDKQMLRYLYEFRGMIQFVIFVNHQKCEIIKLNAIPEILKIQPWDYITYPMPTMTIAHTCCIPINPSKMSEGETHEQA